MVTTIEVFVGQQSLDRRDGGALYRGHGLARELLAAAEQKARALGCCRMTLEVVEGNTRARGVYEKAGFAQASAGGPAGGALFFSKELT